METDIRRAFSEYDYDDALEDGFSEKTFTECVEAMQHWPVHDQHTNHLRADGILCRAILSLASEEQMADALEMVKAFAELEKWYE